MMNAEAIKKMTVQGLIEDMTTSELVNLIGAATEELAKRRPVDEEQKNDDAKPSDSTMKKDEATTKDGGDDFWSTYHHDDANAQDDQWWVPVTPGPATAAGTELLVPDPSCPYKCRWNCDKQLELLDHSIAKHFPHFEFPDWEQAEAPISTPVETPKETPQTPLPNTPQSVAVTEDLTGDPQSKLPDPEVEPFVCPSPSPEAVPEVPSLTSMGLEETVSDELFGNNDAVDEFDDWLREEFPNDPVLEVLDSPPKKDDAQNTPNTWQTVPVSEIDNSTLPPMLEPKQTPRQPKAKREKRSKGTSQPRDPDVQKKQRS